MRSAAVPAPGTSIDFGPFGVAVDLSLDDLAQPEIEVRRLAVDALEHRLVLVGVRAHAPLDRLPPLGDAPARVRQPDDRAVVPDVEHLGDALAHRLAVIDDNDFLDLDLDRHPFLHPAILPYAPVVLPGRISPRRAHGGCPGWCGG